MKFQLDLVAVSAAVVQCVQAVFVSLLALSPTLNCAGLSSGRCVSHGCLGLDLVIKCEVTLSVVGLCTLCVCVCVFVFVCVCVCVHARAHAECRNDPGQLPLAPVFGRFPA